MAERTADEVAQIFSAAGDSVTLINSIAAQSTITDDDIIKAYKKEDGTTSIWTSEDFTAQDAAVTLGKSKY